MDSRELRAKFLEFFKARDHRVVSSSSLVPENDPSALFTMAGMQQFKQYYGAPENALRDFGSKNVVTIQKCIRTIDIEEVGDKTHLTFFEMLGNFSFGGYGKREAIKYAHEFITKELGLSISSVTIFEGSASVPKDEEAKEIWQELGVENIREEGMKDVFWGPTGDSGPCGPTTEIYCKNKVGEEIEIWNIVFNEYFCAGPRTELDQGKANLKKLEISGVDTGMGFERLLTVLSEKESVYETDLFFGEKSREERIITDHLKAALFIITDGVKPGNMGREYVLRRLIRRAIRFTDKPLLPIIEKIKELYRGVYELEERGEIEKEEKRFRETLARGLKEFEKGTDPFILATTYGFPIELTEELAKEKGEKIDRKAFEEKMKEHQKTSQTASVGMFKGGLANHEKETIQLHTAHHLLLAALQAVVGKEVKQRGSNINEKRLRMDFLCDHKLSEEEKEKVTTWVNDKIKRKLKVIRKEMPLQEAEKIGAEMEFGAKYPKIVSLYFILDETGKALSKEFCGGPHVLNTGELGTFKIEKEEAVSAGVRRIKATLSK